jgi:hypothetical protein
MRTWPLLDIEKAIADADLALQDLAFYVETLQGDSEGHYPTPEDAAALLGNAAALRELLPLVIPPRLKADMAEEHAREQEEEDLWDVG